MDSIYDFFTSYHVIFFRVLKLIFGSSIFLVILGLFRMYIIKSKRIKASEIYLEKLIESGKELDNFQRANTTWEILPGHVENVYSIGFFSQILLAFNTSKFYYQVLEHLHERGILDIDKDDPKKFYFSLYENRYLFEDRNQK